MRLAQCFAEAIFCVALASSSDLAHRRSSATFSLRCPCAAARPTFGTPEPALAYLAIGQLARRLGVPLRCGGNLCASKVADAQAAAESANSLWPAFLAGANFMLHSAGWLESGLAMSYEKFVMDVDQLGAFHTLARGMCFDDNGFAFEAFREIGHGKHYLGSQHTLANYESRLLRFRSRRQQLLRAMERRRLQGPAAARPSPLEGQLESYEPPPLDMAADEALRGYIERRKESMPDESG